MLAFKRGGHPASYLIVGNPDIARQVNAGEVKGLLVPGSRRNPLVPDVPARRGRIVRDQSAFETRFGMFAPKGTPADIVKKLNAEFSAIVKAPTSPAIPDLEGFRAGRRCERRVREVHRRGSGQGKAPVDISGVKLEQ
jgi:hypothetical protein